MSGHKLIDKYLSKHFYIKHDDSHNCHCVFRIDGFDEICYFKTLLNEISEIFGFDFNKVFFVEWLNKYYCDISLEKYYDLNNYDYLSGLISEQVAVEIDREIMRELRNIIMTSRNEI